MTEADLVVVVSTKTEVDPVVVVVSTETEVDPVVVVVVVVSGETEVN